MRGRVASGRGGRGGREDDSISNTSSGRPKAAHNNNRGARSRYHFLSTEERDREGQRDRDTDIPEINKNTDNSR